MTITVPFGTSSRIVTWVEPTATDACGGTVSRTQSHNPGANFGIGVTQVMYTFTDQAGNQAMCTFTISGKYKCFH